MQKINFFQFEESVNNVDIFGLCDDKNGNPVYIDYIDKDKWDAVVSKAPIDYWFSPIDNKIFVTKNNSYDRQSLCDALLHTNKTIAFIELKDKRKGAINEAREQLENTIKIFKEYHDVNLFMYKKAFVCNKQHPHSNTVNMGNIAQFKQNTGFILYAQEINIGKFE